MEIYMVILNFVMMPMAVIAVCIFLKVIIDSLKKNNEDLQNLSSKLLSGKESKQGTMLLPVIKMDMKSECNTVLPLPMGAEICAHSMEILTNQMITAPHEQRLVVILQCIKCGAMDKTIAVTSTPPKVDPPRLECRHDWIKEKTIYLTSAFEQMKDTLPTPGSAKPQINKPGKKQEQEEQHPMFKPVPWMFKKKCIKERICSKCGEVDRVVTSNFEEEEMEENDG